jgi:hypothetical protein
MSSSEVHPVEHVSHFVVTFEKLLQSKFGSIFSDILESDGHKWQFELNDKKEEKSSLNCIVHYLGSKSLSYVKIAICYTAINSSGEQVKFTVQKSQKVSNTNPFMCGISKWKQVSNDPRYDSYRMELLPVEYILKPK